MADQDHDFEGGSAGASETIPMQCSSLRKNGHVCIKDHPCKIVEMSTSKTGKHGHAKVHLVGIDIFTGKKYEDICPSTHNMNVPNVTRRDYTVMMFEENFFHLMDDQGDIREDLKHTVVCNVENPDNVVKMIEEAENAGGTLYASVWKAMGEEYVKELKIKS